MKLVSFFVVAISLASLSFANPTVNFISNGLASVSFDCGFSVVVPTNTDFSIKTNEVIFSFRKQVLTHATITMIPNWEIPKTFAMPVLFLPGSDKKALASFKWAIMTNNGYYKSRVGDPDLSFAKFIPEYGGYGLLAVSGESGEFSNGYKTQHVIAQVATSNAVFDISGVVFYGCDDDKRILMSDLVRLAKSLRQTPDLVDNYANGVLCGCSSDHEREVVRSALQRELAPLWHNEQTNDSVNDAVVKVDGLLDGQSEIVDKLDEILIEVRSIKLDLADEKLHRHVDELRKQIAVP